MPSLHDDLAAGLDDLRQAVGSTITYARGLHSVSLTASIGDTLGTQEQSEDGAQFRTRVRDYILKRSQLVLNSVAAVPRVGDVITEADGTRFEVRPLGGEQCWQWSDQATRTHYRIHTQQIG